MENTKKQNETIIKSAPVKLHRRDFIKLLGGGIAICFLPAACLTSNEKTNEIKQRSLPKDYNAFLHIAEDGTVTGFTGKIEMGQGVITSLAQMLADELNVPMEKVKMVMGDTELCPWDMGTWGSMTTRIFGPFMRAAAAEARAVLLELASEKLNVPVNQLEVKEGIVIDTQNNSNSVSYADLTKGKKIERYLDKEPTVEDYTKFNIVGKSYIHQDGFEKVTGKAKYSGDYKLPGMVFARIFRPPSHGAKRKTVDLTRAKQVENVEIIQDGDLIAVLSESLDSAEVALAKIKAEYSFDEMPSNDKTVFEWLLKANAEPKVEVSEGDLGKGEEISEKVIETEFHDPYLSHAPMETHTALANFEDGKLTVWASTQNPFGLQEQLAREFNFPLEKVRVITPFVGGGFGGKSMNMQAMEAAKLAKLSGKPVMNMWTRKEEFFLNRMHPAGVIKVKSGIDKSGLIKLWDYHAYFCGTRGAEIIYNVPNHKITEYNKKKDAPDVHPFHVGAWRAPNNNTNTFGREVQIDILAHAAGMDPFEFRMKNLTDERMKIVLQECADKFGYSPGKYPSGKGLGMAIGMDVGTYVAQIAEIKVDETTGEVKVVRIVCVQDMGLCVNPEGATIQMEGCITMGLGYTLAEEVLFEGGKINNASFATYKIPRFSWLPKIETHILDRKDQPPHGGGEPAIITVGAAICNAIFDATGARLYRMPMTPERVLEAIKDKDTKG